MSQWVIIGSGHSIFIKYTIFSIKYTIVSRFQIIIPMVFPVNHKSQNINCPKSQRVLKKDIFQILLLLLSTT